MKFLKTLLATILIFVSCLFISACGTTGSGGVRHVWERIVMKIVMEAVVLVHKLIPGFLKKQQSILSSSFRLLPV